MFCSRAGSQRNAVPARFRCFQGFSILAANLADEAVVNVDPHHRFAVNDFFCTTTYDKLMALQEEILAALPEEKRPLMDSVQDAINTLLMDEGESAFIEGVTFGVRLMMEVGGSG